MLAKRQKPVRLVFVYLVFEGPLHNEKIAYLDVLCQRIDWNHLAGTNGESPTLGDLAERLKLLLFG